jgi:hypothetical protein
VDGTVDDADGPVAAVEGGWLDGVGPGGDDGLDGGTVDGDGVGDDGERGVGVVCRRRGDGDGLADRGRADRDVWPAGEADPVFVGAGPISR